MHPDVGRRLAEVGGPVKVWVFFTDKGLESPAAEAAALERFAAALPERTRQRRELRRSRPGLVDVDDLPLAGSYVSAVAQLGAPVHVESPWLNALSATVDAAQLAALQELPFVERVQLVGRSVPLATGLAAPVPGDGDGSGFYGIAQAQLDLINLPALHAQGFTGQGVVIGILDTGFRTTHQAFTNPAKPLTVVAAMDFINDDLEVGLEPGDDPTQDDHGTIILGTLAAYDPNNLVGAAYDASFILCKTEDVTQEVQAEEDYYVAGLQFIELNGGDVATSSVGYIDWYTQADLDGLTAVTTVAVNAATANGVHCCTAAGNSTHDVDPATSSLLAPADAFDVITVGAVEITGEVSHFSSDGPTADGRVKPELLTMGDEAASVWPDDDSSLSYSSGTSMSTPQMAGVVACLTQAHPEWSVATMRSQLFDAADYFGEPKPDPVFVTGYGIVDAAGALPSGLALAPVTPGLAGQINSIQVTNATPGQPAFFAWALLQGPQAVPGCPGLLADVQHVVLIQFAFADNAGVAATTTVIPPGGSGLTVFLQAVELASCQVSNLVTAALP